MCKNDPDKELLFNRMKYSEYFPLSLQQSRDCISFPANFHMHSILKYMLILKKYSPHDETRISLLEILYTLHSCKVSQLN